MLKPLIILGAGASFDYVAPDDQTHPMEWRPPLATGLFNPKNFEKIIEQFPEVRGLASDVQTAIAQGVDIETHLSSLQERILNSPDKRTVSQLGASLFYFQELFHQISKNYEHTANNYGVLVNRLNRCGGGCIATFNYDSLLDKELDIPPALDGDYENLRNFPNYTDGDITLIKLHGSWDWKYILPDESFQRGSFSEPYDWVTKNYNQLVQAPRATEVYTVEGDFKDILRTTAYSFSNGTAGNVRHLYPAIAIPLAQKDLFVCPTHHLEVLKKSLQETDRILIVGWKAGDDRLLDLMVSNLRRPVKIFIVAGRDKDSTLQIKNKLDKAVIQKIPTFTNGNIEPTYLGFTDFLRDKRLSDAFFEN